MLRVKLY